MIVSSAAKDLLRFDQFYNERERICLQRQIILSDSGRTSVQNHHQEHKIPFDLVLIHSLRGWRLGRVVMRNVNFKLSADRCHVLGEPSMAFV